MTQELHIQTAEAQAPLSTNPYDRWVNGDGDTLTEFHRLADGFLLRFIDQADFVLTADGQKVSCKPVVGIDRPSIERLYDNAITPLVTNHSGGLCLHGSASVVDDASVAFMGESRRGKTTLAAAMAGAGHPFLSEDVVKLEISEGVYTVVPQKPLMRLFPDSAHHLCGVSANDEDANVKQEIQAQPSLPFAANPAPLRQIFILGPGQAKKPVITPLPVNEALTAMLPNAFILDIEDKPRLRQHFGRLAELAEQVDCFSLDYPRAFPELPSVISSICGNLDQSHAIN